MPGKTSERKNINEQYDDSQLYSLLCLSRREPHWCQWAAWQDTKYLQKTQAHRLFLRIRVSLECGELARRGEQSRKPGLPSAQGMRFPGETQASTSLLFLTVCPSAQEMLSLGGTGVLSCFPMEELFASSEHGETPAK